MKVKVSNMTSGRGNDVPNQFILEAGKDIYFQSYKSIIVRIRNGKVTLDESYWNYSVTTGKYRNQFLGEGIAETRAKIETGEYKLANLNK